MAHTVKYITPKIVVIEFDEQHNIPPIYITDHFDWYQIVQDGNSHGWFRSYYRAYQYAYEYLMDEPGRN